MSIQTRQSVLANLRRRHAAIFDSAIAELEARQTDPWTEALELARHRVNQLKQLSAECGPSVRQAVSAALSALERAGAQRQIAKSKPSRPAKARASSGGS